ncbi:MAG: PQQ-binding-like beta-propeller repeat protein [Prosthecobacter sp.]|jgi:outer membrane protein assembly factor BamB|uniref:outer membrane protein assembly factor BamB family protein n=1 Tax=Prosthecobacter sp. TaxID=1965333 RepID=UPI001A0E9A2C|nr:PQQ-binding-like beta-propeller repeat protein [Prosthecobacter sp.]MBE2287335.1 PQQ-binding-like beta-propeller repeat protein [Prosthecobacter sp.]
MKIPLLLLTAFATVAQAADWPIWRGPNHDGISTEKLTGTAVKKLWSGKIGIGFASFTVADGRVYTTGHADSKDTVFCLDAVSGKPVWKHEYAADLGDKFYEGGTSATPTIEDGKAYHLSRWGDLLCFDAATGKILWQKNIQQETEANIPDWGFSGSPLVSGDLIIVNVGKAGAAVEKTTGKLVWKSDTDNAGYSTPYPITVNGKAQVVIGSGRAYKGVDPKNGTVLWEHTWSTSYGVNAADPILSGTKLFISSGYNKGCALLDLASAEPQEVWRSRVMKNQFNSSVLIDGHLFGSDGDYDKTNALKCIDFATGTEKWSDASTGFCSLMAADGKLIIMTAKGELIIAKADAAKFEPISRTQVLTGRCWSAPVLANGRIYVRNAAGDMACVSVN